MYITVDFSISARITPMGVHWKQFLASSTQISCNLLKRKFSISFDASPNSLNTWITIETF